MNEITFITGNPDKAAFAQKFLRIPVKHHKLSLEEIQSADVREVVEHKAREAYAKLGTPVLIEDASLVFEAMGKMPGPLIKWFFEDPKLGTEGLCRMLDGFSTRAAIAEVCLGIFDGQNLFPFFSAKHGSIPDHPRGDMGWGWDAAFVPDGSNLTWAEMDWDTMNEEDLMHFSLRVPVYREMEGSPIFGKKI